MFCGVAVWWPREGLRRHSATSEMPVACNGRQGKHGFAAHRRGVRSQCLLWGKSPCLGAESASARARSLGGRAGGGAACRATAASSGCSQKHRDAVSTQSRVPTERGSLSPCLLCGACSRPREAMHLSRSCFGQLKCRVRWRGLCLGVAVWRPRGRLRRHSTTSERPVACRGRQGKHGFAAQRRGVRSQ